MFEIANVPYWTPFEIKVVATTNFLQGDGKKSSEKSVRLIRIPLAPDIKLEGPPPPFLSNEATAFTLSVSNI